MSDDGVPTAAETPEEATARRRQFSMRVLFLFPVAIALPFAAAFLFDSPGLGLLVGLGELIVGSIYPPTRLLALPALGLLLLAWLLSPMISVAWAPIRSAQCMNQMKQVVQALHNYHDAYGSFPPAYVTSESGQPMHSWRVLILPYMEQQALYEQYRFDEPWNGPNNSQLADEFAYFRCSSAPSQNSVNTNYVLVTGDGTAWADGRAPRFADFIDGLSETIILVEVAGSNINWMEPEDLTLDQAMRGVNSPLGMCISSWHPAGGSNEQQETAHVAYADGSVVSLKNDLPLEELKKLLTYQVVEKVKRPEE